jgi:hypothetical protein
MSHLMYMRLHACACRPSSVRCSTARRAGPPMRQRSRSPTRCAPAAAHRTPHTRDPVASAAVASAPLRCGRLCSRRSRRAPRRGRRRRTSAMSGRSCCSRRLRELTARRAKSRHGQPARVCVSTSELRNDAATQLIGADAACVPRPMSNRSCAVCFLHHLSYPAAHAHSLGSCELNSCMIMPLVSASCLF